MSRALYFDCFSGAAGDMIVGALLDAGLPFDALRAALSNIGVPGFTVGVDRVMRGPLAAAKFRVHVEEPGETQPNHSHFAEEAAAHVHPPHPPHRPYREIARVIERAAIPPRAREVALRVFARLAEAEAAVHGIAPGDVCFHEVGALDAIADVVGAAVGFDLLGVERFFSSPLTVGGGQVRCAHGLLPSPSPAAAWLLRGAPIRPSGLEAELVTPTGAAIVTTLAENYGDPPAMTLTAVGYGAGDREFPERPNVLRVLLGDLAPCAAPAPDAPGADEVIVVETNVDDLSPQAIGGLFESVLGAGALDFFVTPVLMKKNRPGHLLTALVPPPALSRVEETLFRETTTLGIRRFAARRACLAREERVLRLRDLPVRVKVARVAGRLRFSPEYDDCLRLAREAGIPWRDAAAEALRAAEAQWGDA
ncbi:MAG: nickel pincer cofactor biosynthesis protein LarC [Planctomycetes bacterium]|nr:nickel pincer cofactor biosynthesis protein LarC [Planctomycetota bacterium]